ncbi:MAG: hypothetical protein LC664_12915 [Flavobacteriales bacterium]|nr:hypothetical protein [Flavobacteriales bacterium]
MNNRYILFVYDTTHSTAFTRATMREVCRRLNVPYEKNRKMKLPGSIEADGVVYQIHKFDRSAQPIPFELNL